MDDLRNKAAAGTSDVMLASDLANVDVVAIVGPSLYEADEITPEGTFPDHGSFLEAENPKGPGPRWVECPAGLAAAILELELSRDDFPAQIVVTSAEKNGEGRWEFEVKPAESWILRDTEGDEKAVSVSGGESEG